MERKEPANTPSADFTAFLSSLAAEAFIFLGLIENPVSKKKETNLVHAKYIIDTISMLKDKTKGNLSSSEANAIDTILYDIRMKYLEKTKTPEGE